MAREKMTGKTVAKTGAPGKTTSKVATAAASKVPRDARTGNASRPATACTFSQRERIVMSPKTAGTVKKDAVARAVRSVSSGRTGAK